MYLINYINILKALLLSLFLFFLTRIGFYFYNLNYFQGVELVELFKPLLYGLRFDLSATLIVNTPFIILSLIPIHSKIYLFFKRLIYTVFNFLFLGLCIADFDYFHFTGKKMTQDILFLGGDMGDQADQLLTTHWDLGICGLFVLFCLLIFYPKFKFKNICKAPFGFIRVSLIGFLSLVVTFIGIRGGLQLRSISPKEAFIFEKYELGNLALNSAYSFLRSIEKDRGVKRVYYPSDRAAAKVIQSLHPEQLRELDTVYADHNVVILIIESLSQEYIDEGYAPFFSQLSGKGLYFFENYANGRRSIDALPSLFTGIPALLGKPISQSKYQTNKFYSLPGVLGEYGYDTSFYHGGKKGTMDFDAYTRSIGINKYFSRDEYPDQSQFDGHWGIYDDKYLSYFADELSKKKTPFFSSLFTLSSHEPYSLPESFKNKFPTGNLPIHESIGYADKSLELFFKKAKSMKWFEKTLFIITGDHTQKLHSQEFSNTLGKFRVPLLFYHPSVDLAQVNSEKVTQHVDVPASVFDFLGLAPAKKLLFGTSVFDKNHLDQMLNLSSERYIYYRPGTLVGFDEVNTQKYSVNWQRDKVLMLDTQNLTPSSQLSELKAYIQYFHNGLSTNSIYELNQ